MLPLMLTDRHGETYAVFRADAVIPFGYYPADIDRGLGWAERFILSLPLPEQRRLRDYAYGINPFFGLDPLIELLAQRRLLIYRKDTSKDDKLAIEVLRNSIREVLDQILAEEKKEADAIAREHEKRNILEKGLAYKQEFDKGMVEGAWSLLKFLKEVNDVVSPMMILTRAGKSAWDAAEGGLQGFAGRFSSNMNTAQYREVVEALGFDPAEIDQKTLYLAFDIATVVWEDEDTQAIITRFAKNLAAAQHSLEWANIAGGAAFEIVLTAILAALTAGAGATVALAGKGKYLRRLGELLRDLAEPLKRLKRRWGRGSRGKGAGSGKNVVVEEVEAPIYNEPPTGGRPQKFESYQDERETVNTVPSKGFSITGAAQFSRIKKYSVNPNGVVRTREEAIELAKSHGIEIPEDINIQFVGNWKRTDADAEYFDVGSRYKPDDWIEWDDLTAHRGEFAGTVPVRINKGILNSDEAILANISHEMHELNSLKSMFGQRGALQAKEIARLVNTRDKGGLSGNLHEQAWDVSDSLIFKIRGVY